MIEETGKVCLHVVRQLLNFFKIPYIWYVRFCDWLVYPTYDNGFNQKIAYTGKEAWINRILAIVAVLFILAIRREEQGGKVQEEDCIKEELENVYDSQKCNI